MRHTRDYTVGERIVIGIDLPNYPAGTPAIVVYVGSSTCTTCRQVYRIMFDDGIEWPVWHTQIRRGEDT